MTMTAESHRLLLDAVELARRLNVSRSGLYQWLASGRIPSPVKLGRRALWRVEEITRWVAAGCPPRAQWNPSRH